MDWFKRNGLPPMQNEPNQDAIDAEQARIFREAMAKRGVVIESNEQFDDLYKSVDDFEKFLRS